MKRVEMPGQICRVEEVYWPDRCTINQLPASALLAARDRALARRPAQAGPRTRIYVKRNGTRGIVNDAAIDGVLDKHQFVPVMMEDLTVTQQIDLFSQADMVVATHGAALANLIFCPPGTRVLELSPDCEYRPFFNEICGKLGLAHAIMPCPTDDGGFNGRLTVPPNRLGLLLSVLAARRAA
jgi:capsular polysaccharide biosynthesis protein